MKSKNVAAALALFMGVFGVHRLYLGQRFIGILHLMAFFFCFGITVASDGEAPLIIGPALIGFIDAVLLFAMPHREFDEKFNRRYLADQSRYNAWPEEYPAESYSAPQRRSAPVQPDRQSVKRRGIELFRQYDFSGAIRAFEEALELDFEDASTHFNLACCYSMIQEADPAFYHLEQAIELGFTNLDRIHRHDALTFLRAQPIFDDFVANGYRRVESPPPLSELQQAAKPADVKKSSDDVLQQIIKLGDLRDKGILTEQEFAHQKRKLLGE